MKSHETTAKVKKRTKQGQERMQLDVRGRWFFITVALGLGGCALQAGADAFSEASPVPQSQASVLEAKQTSTKATEGKEAAASSEVQEEDLNEEGPNDPLEPLNRLVFEINDLLDFILIRPVAEIYRAIVPEPVRNGVTNVLDNLFTPVVFLNHILQGEPERATASLFRFLMNSTFGMAGLVDVTSDLGFPRYDTDFNQTLTAWGIETGPYLVLPLIGPSSFRGTIAFAGDYYADPLNLYLINRHHRKYRRWLTIRYGMDMINRRSKLIETIDNLRNGSLDFYVTMRSIYFQRQAYMAESLKPKNLPEEAKEEGKPHTP